jgi:hypothetical protein
MPGSRLAGVPFPSSSPLEGNTSTRGLSGRRARIRGGSSRRSGTSIALEPATAKGFSRPSINGPRIPRDASEQRREKTGRSTARAAGREDKRSASKRGKRPDVVIERWCVARRGISRWKRTVAELTGTRPRQGSRAEERRCPRSGRPASFTRCGARAGLGRSRTTPRNFQRGGRSKSTTGRQRRCVTRVNRREENARPARDHESTEARTVP